MTEGSDVMTEGSDVMTEGSDVMSCLLRWDLDLLLRQVFLSLDVTSLRAARQVRD